MAKLTDLLSPTDARALAALGSGEPLTAAQRLDAAQQQHHHHTAQQES